MSSFTLRSIFVVALFSLITIQLSAAEQSDSSWLRESRSSETLKAQKGLFRLLSADVVEQGDYNLRASFEYFEQNNLFKDTFKVRRTRGTLAFGYAFLPWLQFAFNTGFNFSNRIPPATSGGGASESSDLLKIGASLTGVFDVGDKWFGLQPQRLTTGLNVGLNFSKITRFFKAIDVAPTWIVGTDWSDKKFPIRAHFNLGLRLANGKRYFDESSAVSDFERFSTDTIQKYAIVGGIGAELPFSVITPSVEIHVQKVKGLSLSNTPMWITPGVKARPFPQKNIEIMLAGDIGLNSYVPTSGIGNAKPMGPAVPLWNIVFGFGISRFGKKKGEIGVNAAEYKEMQQTVAGLQRDLGYNTVAGRVVDADSKQPVEGVSVSFPESPELKTFTTDESGRFMRFFKSLSGARIAFKKEGYESSSKFLAMKPGERITVDVELKKDSGRPLGDLVVSISDHKGQGVKATVTLTNKKTGETIVAMSDASGQVFSKVPEGTYKIEVTASGYRPMSEEASFERGKTLLRSYSLKKASGE